MHRPGSRDRGPDVDRVCARVLSRGSGPPFRPPRSDLRLRSNGDRIRDHQFVRRTFELVPSCKLVPSCGISNMIFLLTVKYGNFDLIMQSLPTHRYHPAARIRSASAVSPTGGGAASARAAPSSRSTTHKDSMTHGHACPRRRRNETGSGPLAVLHEPPLRRPQADNPSPGPLNLLVPIHHSSRLPATNIAGASLPFGRATAATAKPMRRINTVMEQ